MLSNKELALKRIKKELNDLVIAPISGITANPIGHAPEGFFECRATIRGPAGTPYENGLFVLSMKFPEDYPFVPPKVNFLTPVFHPNVKRENGRIGLDIYHPNSSWVASMTIRSLLLSIRVFLADPNPNPPNCSAPPLEPVIADLYNISRDEFEAHATSMTIEKAM